MAPAFEDDDLDELPAKKSTPAAATATAAAPAQTTTAVASPAPGPEDDLNVDFGDEKVTSYSDGLDKVNPEKGKSIRCALATDILSPKAAYTHYIETGEKKGNYRCLKPLKGNATGKEVCCAKLGDNYLYVVVPVVVYTNADQKGVLPKDQPIDWKIGYLRIGRSLFRTIGDLPATLAATEDAKPNAEPTKPTDLDLHLSRLTNGKWDVKAKTTKARWRQNPEFVEQVKAAFAPFLDGKKLESKLGRKLDVLQFKALIASLSGGRAEDADMSNVDEL
jgi:hypothetical protein